MDPRLNDESRAYLQFLRTGFGPVTDISIKGMRLRAEAMHRKMNENIIGTFKGQEVEKKIQISGNLEIPITVYTPVDAEKDKIVVYFHGGGWTVGSRQTHQTIVNMMADATKSVWISVEYRLAPEHQFPVFLDDSREVTQHILANKADYGGDEKTKVGVSGDSAGGLIAAALGRTVKNLDFQIPICGQFYFADTLPSRKDFDSPDMVLTKDMRDWFESNAFKSAQDKTKLQEILERTDPSATVSACLFIVAELDPLRDDSYKYQEFLEQAGVKTKLVSIKGAVHPFLSSPGIFTNSCQQSIDAVAAFMAEF